MTQIITFPDWMNWRAQDADGVWWGFEQEPLQHDVGWYENEVGRYIKLNSEPANAQWRETLQQINNSA